MNLSRRHFLFVPGLIGAGLFAISAWNGPAYADTGLPDAFPGSFRGTVVGPAGVSSGDFTVVIEQQENGFIVRWPPRRAVEFQPADRPGVYRTDGDANPITGETAYWARIDGDSLIIYSVQIDEHGVYDIHNYIYAPAGNGLDLVIRRIRGGAEPIESKGRLEKNDR